MPESSLTASVKQRYQDIKFNYLLLSLEIGSGSFDSNQSIYVNESYYCNSFILRNLNENNNIQCKIDNTIIVLEFLILIKCFFLTFHVIH